MKKSIILISLFLSTVQSNAQHRVFAPELGLNFSSIHATDGDVTLNSKTKVGIRTGFTLDGRFTKTFHLQTGLFYSHMGGSNSYYATSSSSFQKEKTVLNISYFQLPVHFVFKINVKKVPGEFLIGFGPYVGYAVSGKYKEGTASVKIKIGDDAINDDVKPLDYGFDFLVGYELPIGLFAKLGYIKGFANIDPYSDNSSKTSVDNKGVMFSIGCYVGGKKKSHQPSTKK